MSDNKFQIWGYDIPNDCVSEEAKEYLMGFSQHPVISVEKLWEEIDRVWNELSLSNKRPLQSQSVKNFYSHPVWILNGLFSALDSESVNHREAIANYAKSLSSKKIADFGGGFCELAIQLSKSCPTSSVNIIEPFPSELGKYRISEHENISFLNSLDESYDLLIAQDVLEHVDQPIKLAAQLSHALSKDGIAIFANCFFPYIECHLPKTFHLRQTSPWVVKPAGLEYVGSVAGASHCQVFKKIDDVNHKLLYRRERYSKLIGPLYNATYKFVKKIKNI